MRFLCDEQIGIPIFHALEREGFDILHVLAEGLGGTADPQVFQHAIDRGRILLTRNYRDFAPLVEKRSSSGVSFPGVLFIATSVPQADIGAHIRALKRWSEGMERGANLIEKTYGWLR
ncbi:MAG: DUF5615 family PIN-like protein [Gemmatimonadetes bacterium]|jgi:predicted nuclease of predicted toxin-antitoxin system|nr:DUF5615 family PIN-like protein [Gemmatimonadota bacterium]